MTESSTSASTYTIIRVPNDSPRLPEFAAKFRETKLAALVAEPNGFAVKYAEESLHPFTIWQERFLAPSNILICVASPEFEPSTNDEEALIAGTWVGMATIRGPLPYSTFHLPESGQPVPDDPSLETRWHFNNLYTLQAHRGKGLARKLIDASLVVAQNQTRTLQGEHGMKARVRLFFNPEKEHLRKLYESLGFVRAGSITLKEAFGANGDGDLVPEDTTSAQELRERWERRYGVSMERLLDV
ncbi:hypothetical protein BDV96DRAFT_500017 [Lophiotrema nucula]|uniref:N-acetyltransferase domain-containing protein n=1 Tax=Lophiotrema nucula TaxID=690887 RepID=A0A6A5YVA0_9PLEO|nr:hypothetical protein BDV96DRAFT_500017 [Lophiotrema nucula]